MLLHTAGTSYVDPYGSHEVLVLYVQHSTCRKLSLVSYSNASVTEVNVDVSDGDPWGKREAAQHGLRRLHPATAAHTGRAVSENYVRSLQQG